MHIPIEDLHRLQTHASAGNHEQSRIDYLAKFIFIQAYVKIGNMNEAMKLCDLAIRNITTVRFFENYMGLCGSISWEKLQGKAIKGDGARLAFGPIPIGNWPHST